ncbi:hypothetical protein GW587_22240 [Duganella sp. SAP-35]|uniref:Uncharacterized protein n=1 Tax=Duganella aceris TaxID=2703883 RepID=A0ABX0FRC4_9BURK|nr:hypothetical protein [Duganella aceris]
MSVQLSPTSLLRLVEQQRLEGGAHDLSEAINTALEFWLDAKAALSPGADPAKLRGYQWKSLFLPEGTILRSWSYGEHNYARVEGDKIMHQGRSVSPNEFARFFARTARNAWFDLSVRRPGDKRYTMADVLRREQAKQERTTANTPIPTAPAAMPVATPAAAEAPPAPAPTPAPRCKTDFDPGWDLPERRKFRCRLEDVAY